MGINRRQRHFLKLTCDIGTPHQGPHRWFESRRGRSRESTGGFRGETGAEAVVRDRSEAVVRDRSEAVVRDRSEAVVRDRSEAVVRDRSRGSRERQERGSRERQERGSRERQERGSRERPACVGERSVRSSRVTGSRDGHKERPG